MLTSATPHRIPRRRPDNTIASPYEWGAGLASDRPWLIVVFLLLATVLVIMLAA